MGCVRWVFEKRADRGAICPCDQGWAGAAWAFRIRVRGLAWFEDQAKASGGETEVDRTTLRLMLQGVSVRNGHSAARR